MHKTFRFFGPGTISYVIHHAQWRASRGKAPSATLGDIRNPRIALAAAEQIKYKFIDPGLDLKDEEEFVEMLKEFSNAVEDEDELDTDD